MIFGILRNIVLLTLLIVASHLLAVPFGIVLSTVLDIGGSFAGDTFEYYMFGLPLAATFLLVFVFVIFGGKYKLWWIGIAAVPILWFEFELAPILFVFSVLLSAIGCWLGLQVSIYLRKTAPTFMLKIG